METLEQFNFHQQLILKLLKNWQLFIIVYLISTKAIWAYRFNIIWYWSIFCVFVARRHALSGLMIFVLHHKSIWIEKICTYIVPIYFDSNLLTTVLVPSKRLVGLLFYHRLSEYSQNAPSIWLFSGTSKLLIIWIDKRF